MGKPVFELFKRIRSILATRNLKSSTTNADADLIGPPNRISNLRPIKFAVRQNETEREMLLRKEKKDLQQWNEAFWFNHNMRFMKEKENFINNEMKGKDGKENLTADEMSVFYKQFLDNNWKNHFQYNLNWHKKNFKVTYLEILVILERLFRKS